MKVGGLNEDFFKSNALWSTTLSIKVCAVTSETFGSTNHILARCFVTCAPMTHRICKSFQQNDRITKMFFPVCRNAPCATSKHSRRKIINMITLVWQNQKTADLNYKMTSLKCLFCGPSYPAITVSKML
jgi:hypothetical protein